MKQIFIGIIIITVSSVLCIVVIDRLGLLTRDKALETVSLESIGALERNLDKALSVVEKQAGISDRTLIILTLIGSATLIIIIALIRRPLPAACHTLESPSAKRISYDEGCNRFLPDYYYQDYPQISQRGA